LTWLGRTKKSIRGAPEGGNASQVSQLGKVVVLITRPGGKEVSGGENFIATLGKKKGNWFEHRFLSRGAFH